MKPVIVALSMGGHGHVQALMAVVSGLCKRGLNVYVATESAFRVLVESHGAVFIDLYGRFPIEAADSSSTPVPSRYVSFAGFYGRALSEYLVMLNPSLIIYDMFAVVGPVVAKLLGIPYVAVCPNHAPVAQRDIRDLHSDPRVSTADACWRAVEQLRDIYGMENASPFSYADGVSPYLNLYGEPEEFITAEERAALEPVMFYGVLTPEYDRLKTTEAIRIPGHNRNQIYISFGTVVWWYFKEAAVAALLALVDQLRGSGREVTISLGSQPLEESVCRKLTRYNTRLIGYADQWRELSTADVFVTHHGLNSTHESIFIGTPMLSYPFFGDQPRMARRCQDMGLAIALTSIPMGPVDQTVLNKCLQRLASERQTFAERLLQAREWELRTIENRGIVLDRIEVLAIAGA